MMLISEKYGFTWCWKPAWVVCAAAVLCGVGAVAAQTPDVDLGQDFSQPNQETTPTEQKAPSSDIAAIPPELRGLWSRNWFQYARGFVEYEGSFFGCDLYDPRYKSSAHLLEDQVLNSKSQTIVVQRGGFRRENTLKPDAEEVKAAAMALPGIGLGQYGYVRACRVNRILGPNKMEISAIELVDNRSLTQAKSIERRQLQQAGGLTDADINALLDKRFSSRETLVNVQSSSAAKQPMIVIGYPTAGLVAGNRWTGPSDSEDGIHLAIVDVHTVSDNRNRRTQQAYIAINASLFSQSLSEAHFVEMLATRQMTPKSFTESLREELRSRPQQARTRMFAKLFENRPQPEPPAEAEDQPGRGRGLFREREQPPNRTPPAEQPEPEPQPEAKPAEKKSDPLFDFSNDFN